MEQVFERVCGLDVHKTTIAACVRAPDVKGKRVQYVQTFGTTTADLLALRDWLDAARRFGRVFGRFLRETRLLFLRD